MSFFISILSFCYTFSQPEEARGGFFAGSGNITFLTRLRKAAEAIQSEDSNFCATAIDEAAELERD